MSQSNRFTIVIALVAGITGALSVSWMTVDVLQFLVVLLMLMVVILSWCVAYKSGAVEWKRRWSVLIFGPFKPQTALPSSALAKMLCVVAGFLLGILVRIIWSASA